jgi:TetR/AcrR family transcriptional regulator
MAARKATQSDDLWQSFKRQSIQQAVIQLMCREGLPSVTMDRVAQEAGIAKGTIYLHYKDKQELLDDVKNSSLDPMVTRMDEVFASEASPDRKLQTYSQRYLQYFDERRDLFRILLYEREVVRVQSARYQGNRYKHLVDQTARAIREGMKKRIFREVDDRSIAVMFVEANVAIMNQRLMTDSPRPVEDDAQIIIDLFLSGLARVKR